MQSRFKPKKFAEQCPLKILNVVPAYLPALNYDGAVVAAHGLARSLASRGHDVEVVTTDMDPSGRPTCAPARHDGVKIQFFRPTYPRSIHYAPDMSKVLPILIQDFDVLHVHQISQWPGWAAARFARRHRIPYVVSPRDMLVTKRRPRRSQPLNLFWTTFFDKPLLGGASAIHVTSELEQAQLEHLNFKTPIVTIPNGVDDPGPIPSSAEVSSDVRAACTGGPIALYLGQLNRKDELDRLVCAHATTPNGRLIIAGPDKDNWSRRISSLAQGLGILDRVHILPRTLNRSDKDFLFAATRVFVSPSRSERFGNAALEAMRRGVPVITTPQVGVAEIVRRSGGGLVTSGEQEALGYAMARFLNHPALARSMGVAARNHVAERYGWQNIAEQMEKLYETLGPRSADTG